MNKFFTLQFYTFCFFLLIAPVGLIAQIPNGGFEDGTEGWEQFSPRGAEYTFEIATSDSPEGGQHAVLNVTNLGTNSPNQGLNVGIRTGFNIPVTGGTYKLSYRIKSATPDKNIRARLILNDGGDGGQGVVNGEVHIAPTEWTLFEQNVVVPELTDTENPTMFIRVLLGIGGTLGDISIDNLMIVPTEVSPPADNDGDGFTDDVDCDDTNAAINPNAVEVNDNDVDENCDGVLGMTAVEPGVLNLGFEDGMANWTQFTPRGAEYTFDIATSDSPEGGQHAVLNVTNLGTNTPNQGLAAGIRTGFNVPVTGGTYKLSYRIKSATPDKNFRARLIISDGADEGQGVVNGEVHIAPAEWTLFEQNVVVPDLTSTENPTKFARVVLGVAGTLGDISIDDIVIAPTEVSPPADSDGDGFTADVDCDDTNAAINPNAVEVNDNDVDENCDGVLGMTAVEPGVLNLGFEDGMTNWEQFKPRGAEYTFEIATSDSPEGGQHAVLNVTNLGTNTPNQGLAAGIRTGFNVPVTGGTYKLSYRIKSATPDKNFRARLIISDGGDGGQGAVNGEVHIAPAEWTLFEQDIVVPELTDTENPTKFVRVLLGVAGTLGDISIDDIVIAPTEVTPPADNDGDGFAADVDCDDTNAAINPNAVEVNDNDVDENCDGVLGMTVADPNILNLGFEEGMVNWEQATPRGAELTFEIATSDSPEGGQHAVLNVTSQGTNTPNQGLAVGIRTAFNVPVTGGTYKLSYRIKSATPDKNFRARLFINDGGDGGQGTINGEVHIAPAEWTLFEQDIVVPELTETGNPTKFARVFLGVGGTLGDISIDDIVLAPVDPVSSIFGPSIETFNLNVYPTLLSSQQTLTVDLTNFNNDQIDFSIYNTTGQLIKTQTVNGGMPTAIAIEQLPSGTYILQGRHENYQLIGKFIVLK